MNDSLLGLLLFLPLVLAGYGVGNQLFLRRGVTFHSLAERALFAIPLGLGIIGFIVFICGMLGFLPKGLFIGLLLLAGLAFVPGGKDGLPTIEVVPPRAGARGPISPSSAGRTDTTKLLTLCALLVCGVMGLCTLLGALAPPGGIEWDAQSYHLAVPKTYLREGRIFFIPYDHHSNFPFLWQMLYMLELGLGTIAGAKLCHWLCGVLLVLSVYTFAERHLGEKGKTIGLLAAIMVATTPIFFWEASVAYVDLATALLTWLSLYGMFNAMPTAGEKTGNLKWLVLSAILMGFALGTKLTVLAFWGMFLIGTLGWNFVTTGKWAKETIPHAVLWGGISFAIGAVWLVKTDLYTGSPVYPFFYNIFGGRYWNAENAAQYTADQATLGMGKSPVDLLLSLWRTTMKETSGKFNEYGIFALSPVYVGLLLAAPLVAKRRSFISVALGMFSLGTFLYWFYLVQQARYLIPALPAFALLAAETLVLLFAEGKGVARYVGGALVAASALWGMYLSSQLIAMPAVRVVTGTQTRTEYVTADFTGLMKGLYPAIEHINQTSPKDAKVALFDEVFGFYLDREYIWATPNHAADLLPWDTYKDVDDWLADFKRRGYTYLLVNEGNAPKADSPLASQRWRSLLSDAIIDGKVTQDFEAESRQTPNGPVYIHVWRIP